MNHWLETSKRNLLPLSQASDFSSALKEWTFTGHVEECEGADCELCEHPELNHHFQIKNRNTTRQLLVGSSCILKFQEINVVDAEGVIAVENAERKAILAEALKAKLSEIMLEPLRKLWLRDKTHKERISRHALELKRGGGVGPSDLVFIFHRLEVARIAFEPARYKISLRSDLDKYALSRMSAESFDKIRAALSPQQLQKAAVLRRGRK